MLAILFHSTGGNQWKNSNNWVTSNDHSSWFGVRTASSTKYVFRLDLYSNKLTGSIPSEIAALTSLTALYLFDNDLTGPIPSEIGALTSLQGLSLYNNDFTGPIPAEVCESTTIYLRADCEICLLSIDNCCDDCV